MFLNSNRWERRFDQIVKAVAWVTLTYGFFYSLRNDPQFPGQIDAKTLTAFGFAGVYVIALTVIPGRFMMQRRRLVVETVTLIGSALAMTAVSLTGGAHSPYVLLSFTPILYGSFFGAFRIGLATAAFSASLLLVQTFPFEQAETVQTMVRASALYFLVGLTFSQARRLLVAEVLRASATAQAFEQAQLRLSRLEHANDLLTRLSTLADSRELNPIEVGDAALEGLTRILPINSGMTALASDQGPVIVARRGAESPDDAKSNIPLQIGDREVGLVTITTDEPLTPS